MDTSLPPTAASGPTAGRPEPAGAGLVKVFGVGNTGLAVLEQLIGEEFAAEAFCAINTEAPTSSGAAHKLQLESRLLRGMGSGGDPERGRALAQEQVSGLKELCQGASLIFVVAGLGGGAGTGISPVLVQVAKESGALVLAFVTTPFECEGSRRQQLAQQGLEELTALADGVICLPNQKVFKLIDETTSVLETFRRTNGLLADAVRGLWRLLKHQGLLPIHSEELCALLRERHSQSAFAVAEASGPGRASAVVDKLLAHPLLEEGQVLSQSEAVLVSLMGGTELTMAEVNRVMESIKARCPDAQLLLGAAVAQRFEQRLAVTLIAARPAESRPQSHPRGGEARAEGFEAEMLSAPSVSPRPKSRLVPPVPNLSHEELEKLMARQRGGAGRPRKALPKMSQAQLPLEIVSKGRFDKSEPTIHKGEDLDVPTYLRRGVSLN